MSDPLTYGARMLGVRNRKVAAGERVSVHHCNGGYWLPDGLPEGAAVTVHSIDIGYVHVLDAHGGEWKLALSCIQRPSDVWWHGAWIDWLTHPHGRTAWECWVAHERAEMEEGRWREHS